MARSEDEEFEENEEEEQEVDEEDEDEYEEEEEEDSNIRKKKKSRSSYFYDEEAEDDAEEEYEYEEAEHGWSQSLANTETEKDKARRRELDYSRITGKSEEELVKHWEEKARYYDDQTEVDDEDLMEGLPRQAYWRVKVRLGEERYFAAMLMQKFLNTQFGKPEEMVLVHSVIVPQHLPGHVYIEAQRETHVKQAIKGMPGLLPNSPQLIPLQDIIEVLSTSKKNVDVTPGGWVRVKLGKYKSDIGKVISYDPAKGRLTVKLIPRIDFSEITEPLKKKEDEDMEGEENKDQIKKPKRKRTRPQAKPFNHDEVMKLFPSKIVQRGNKRQGYYYVFQGERYIDGFLYKILRLTSVVTDGVVPTLEELGKFQDRDENKPNKDRSDSEDEDEDIENGASLSSNKGILDSVLPSISKKPNATFSKGDTVKVIEGDLKNLMGVVESVDEHSITIMPTHEGIKDLLLFKDHELQKYFKIGDHVKVISGRYDGETGLVLRVEDITIVLLSDLTMTEIKVKIQDLQECSEISTGKLELGNYQLHDLVQTTGHRVGIIIKVERDSFKILDENSTVTTVKLQQVGNKRRTDASALDAYGNTVNAKDMIEVADGLFKGKQGTVLKIARNFLFCKGKDVFENGGVFVVRPNYTHLLGGSKNKPASSVGGYSQNNSFNSFNNNNSSNNNNNNNNNNNSSNGGFRGGRGGGRGGFRGGRGGGRGGRDDSPVHKIVTIKSGNWKGYTGIVKECSDDMVQVELQTNSKKINLKMSEILFQNQRLTTTDYQSDQNSLYLSSKTPAYGDHGLATPMHPSSGGGSRSSDRQSDHWSVSRNSDRDDTYSSTPGTNYSSYSPYTPHTPSEGRYNDSYNTPYDQRNMSTPNMSTPSISNYDTPTPGSYNQNNYDQPTPHDIPQSPYTPINQPQTPSTPSEEPEEDDQPYWKGTKIEVIFTSSSNQGKHAMVLDNQTESTCKVQFLDSQEIISNVSQDILELAQPAKKDRVVVVKGSYTGHTGTLFVLLGAIGIVKIDTNLDFKVFKMSQLGKLLSE